MRGRKYFRRCQSVRGAGRRDEHWLDAIAIWERALQSLDLRKVVDDYVGIGRVPREKVLVIVFSREEGSARLDHGDDRGVERMRIVELGDVVFRNSSLLSRCREDRRTIWVPASGPCRLSSIGSWAIRALAAAGWRVGACATPARREPQCEHFRL